jgi:hypothetical protein
MRPKHLVTRILGLLVLTLPASPAHAGGVVSICDEAHLLAALSGGGTVTFTCSGTITLASTITIAANTTIDGSGQNVTISGNHALQVFIVDSGVALNLKELTIADAVGGGGEGGILNQGTLTISNCAFTDNSGYGGCIYNYGTLTVSNSTFSGNYGGGHW